MSSNNPLRALKSGEHLELAGTPEAARPQRSGVAEPADYPSRQDVRVLEVDVPLQDGVVLNQPDTGPPLDTAWLSRLQDLFNHWAPLVYIGMTGLAQIAFIEMYCRWHGAWFLFPNPFNLYDASNIQRLANMDFVAFNNGVPTTMSVAAEVLMWSSLGVWAHRLFSMSRRYRERVPDLPYDVATYIGILARNTSVAATIIIILRLSDFSVFGVSLDRFDATVGTAFLLGFFGEDAYRLLCKLRDSLLGLAPNGRKAGSDPDAPV